ncbi:MAG: GNAT family N-acetyltransferase [Lachnospiraceae bacterium]|nr:GNAT family N-acetyltransferase [Lachnospiraceae bacterium]
MNLQVISIDNMDRDVWDAFVRGNSQGYAYHLYDVIRWDRWINDKDISFCIQDDRIGIVMVVQLHIEYKSNEGKHRLHSEWGYVLKDGLTRKEKNKVKVAFMEHIDRLIIEKTVTKYNIGVAPLSEYMQPQNHVMVNPVVEMGFAPFVRYTYIVDLNKPKEELLANCEQTTRQAIRKIRSDSEYVIREASACEKDCQTYLQLHEQTYTRTGAAGAIIHEPYQRNIFFTLIPKGIARVFFLTEAQTGNVLAATVILLYKNSAYYWWGASVDEKEVGINKYLLFASMMHVRPENMAPEEHFWFETGGAYPYARSGKEKGLNDFKKCFGTMLHPIFRGEYVFSPDVIR